MNLIILPGNSKEYNEDWLNDWATELENMFDSVTKHVFEHWKTGGEMIDYDVEVKKLVEETKNIGEEYVIFAKSAGTITTVKAVTEEKISPQKCVFTGSPWSHLAKDIGGEKNISKYKIPTLFIQQTDDMFYKYAELEKLLEDHELGEYELVEIPGSNHAYDNEEIKQMISDFIF